MVEKHFILLFDNDLITSSILTLSIQVIENHSHIYQVADAEKAINLIERIALSSMEHHIRKEICIIVDLNMEQNKGYNFLDTLEKMLPCPIKVYTVKNEHHEFIQLPHHSNSFISGELGKPLGMDEVEEIFFPERRVVYRQEVD